MTLPNTPTYSELALVITDLAAEAPRTVYLNVQMSMVISLTFDKGVQLNSDDVFYGVCGALEERLDTDFDLDALIDAVRIIDYEAA